MQFNGSSERPRVYCVSQYCHYHMFTYRFWGWFFVQTITALGMQCTINLFAVQRHEGLCLIGGFLRILFERRINESKLWGPRYLVKPLTSPHPRPIKPLSARLQHSMPFYTFEKISNGYFPFSICLLVQSMVTQPEMLLFVRNRLVLGIKF